jgi:hypothetical protein
VERRLFDLSLSVDVCYMIDKTQMAKAVDALCKRGLLYVVCIDQLHADNAAVTLHVLHSNNVKGTHASPPLHIGRCRTSQPTIGRRADTHFKELYRLLDCSAIGHRNAVIVVLDQFGVSDLSVGSGVCSWPKANIWVPTRWCASLNTYRHAVVGKHSPTNNKVRGVRHVYLRRAGATPMYQASLCTPTPTADMMAQQQQSTQVTDTQQQNILYQPQYMPPPAAGGTSQYQTTTQQPLQQQATVASAMQSSPDVAQALKDLLNSQALKGLLSRTSSDQTKMRSTSSNDEHQPPPDKTPRLTAPTSSATAAGASHVYPVNATPAMFQQQHYMQQQHAMTQQQEYGACSYFMLIMCLQQQQTTVNSSMAVASNSAHQHFNHTNNSSTQPRQHNINSAQQARMAVA